MTSIWGPLGWMTLHSVAHNYPEVPSEQEKQLLSQWLDLFRETITCPSCQGHFADMLRQYRSMYPYFIDSRKEFLVFTYRAHNTVNRRVDKPIYHTIEECEALYTKNVSVRPSSDYRTSYLRHIHRHWMVMRDMNGISALRKVGELFRIESQYWNPRNGPPIEISGISVSPLASTEVRSEPSLQLGRRPPGAVSFVGGRLRFRQ